MKRASPASQNMFPGLLLMIQTEKGPLIRPPMEPYTLKVYNNVFTLTFTPRYRVNLSALGTNFDVLN